MGITPTVDSWLLPLTQDIDKSQFRAWAKAIESALTGPGEDLTPTKGELAVGDGSSFAGLDVGANGQMLVAASGEDVGIKWGDFFTSLQGGVWKADSIASASTCDLATIAANYVTITGTADITSFGTGANLLRFVTFEDALTLTHDDTSLKLPGGDDIETAAGDTAIFISDASGNWTCLSLTPLVADTFAGDSGSGGLAGLVPAPAAGDAAAGKFLKATGGWAVPAGGAGQTFRNRIVNSIGRYTQAGVGSITDGNYSGFDQWYVLTQTASVTTSQLTDVEDGMPFAMRVTQAQSTAQRMGIAQVLEALESKGLRSSTVALSARVRMSASTTLRFAILGWTGTADSPTKDVVADWTSGTFTAGNFFLSSNVNVVATGSIALTANTLTDISLSGTMGSSLNNVIVLFWTNSTQAQNVTLDVSKVWFGLGSSGPTTFEPMDQAADLERCQRYFWTTYGLGVAIGTVTDNGALYITSATTGAGGVWLPLVYPTRMRTAPTGTVYSPQNGASGNMARATTNVAATFASQSDISGNIANTAATTSGLSHRAHLVLDARL